MLGHPEFTFNFTQWVRMLLSFPSFSNTINHGSKWQNLWHQKTSVLKYFPYFHLFLGRISRWNYIKMVFDFKRWRKDSMSLMSSTISGIYATLLICIYLTFSFTELVKFPSMKTYQDENEPDLQGYLEKRGFFIYLFLGCNLYYVYILISLLRAKK